MRGVGGLIRLWKWRLDERRRIVVDLEVLRAGIERQIERLDQELEHERKVASQHYEAGYGFAAYRRANRERRANLEMSREEVIDRIRAAQEDVNDAFRELKKYELVLENWEKRERQKQERREQAELDEAGLASFRRRQEQPDGQPG
ncbi:flagellar FliJ family protein [uncultured Ferrovibrio sp.]|jgi:flagellar FliJ protein|uniref:flagellar FliJ family protein n=1 Tax=uncultured Ferrovibrio sp. TaxID=1576913 RepID=UPI0026392746|nr:flagellar FliJ family protein [uncultured Ferrovibrio sp.]